MSRAVLLASASTSRFRLLVDSGIDPYVQVSQVDEDLLEAHLGPISTAQLVVALATAKGEAVVQNIKVTSEGNLLIIAADSMLELDGVSYGKPVTPEVARQRWQQMRGKTGYLHSGHWVHDLATGQTRTGVAGAQIHFGHVTDAEIDDYVASGEPLGVAGGFTHEGRSSAFITRIDGDVAAVAGMSMSLLRQLAGELGISWTSLWK
ncbi:MAG: septum formation protein Maf [Actinobacteria bacterium]|nr:septum formation protein Maf [Actinomycetota bacterium]NBY15306.1 septum formation protein Maf [Actinomycetota bacterium]